MGRSLATVVLCLGAWSFASSSEPAPAPPPDAAGSAVRSPADMPFWAYGITTLPQPGDTARELPWGRLFDPDVDHAQQLRPTLHLAGSPRTYAPIELRDWANAPDWFPDEHPPMPEVVQHGVAALGEKRRGCAICHRVNGGGRPDNAAVAGLPVDYFLRQLDDFRSGRRHSSDPRKPNVRIMQEIAQAIMPDEAREAAEYYAGRSGAPRLHVVESDRAPPVTLHGNQFAAIGTALTEPLIDRIVEVLDGDAATFWDNPHVGYMAYVPRGSIARGRALAFPAEAAAGRPVGPPCASCHGVDLHGLGSVPPLAGRSPSYLVRQLHDFSTGARDGPLASAMRPIATGMSTPQMTDLAAYLASLP